MPVIATSNQRPDWRRVGQRFNRKVAPVIPNADATIVTALVTGCSGPTGLQSMMSG
jgi:hypothetical protein